MERARLAALADYDILDTVAERGFDDIVFLASQICETPVALVSLVGGDRQWFKARIGFEPCETPIGQSVCAHALGRTDLLVIPDLAADSRTKDNTLVTGEPFVRFYAGAPLTTPEGHTLGTLCVIDRIPRPDGLTPAQAGALEALAGQVMTQLELRRAVADRDASMAEQLAGQARTVADAARLEALIATKRVAASAAADLDTVFQAIVEGALSVVDASTGAVVELRDGEDLVYRTVSGTSAPHLGLRVPLHGTLSGRALLSETPTVCADTHAEAAESYALARSLGVRSMIAVPISRHGEAIGVLKVQSGKPDVFSARDILMAQMLAGLVASAFGQEAEARAHRALRDAEVRYRQVFDSSIEFGIIAMDRQGLVTDWNVGAERIFGWSAQEMRGQSADRFFTPLDRKEGRVEKEMALARRDGRAVDERWHLKKDGSRFWASGDLMPLRGDDGEHLGFVKILRDRTEEHQARERLMEAETLLRRAQEAGGVGMFSIDIGTDVLHATPEFCRLYGLCAADRLPADAIERLVVFEDEAIVSRKGSRTAGEAPADVEYRIRRASDGELRWISRKGEFERDADGRPIRFVGVARDVTDQVAARRQLEDEREQLAQMFAQAPTFMALLRGPEHRFEKVNPGYLRLIRRRDVVGRTVSEALPDAAAQGFVDVLDEVFRSGEPFSAEGTRYAVQAEPGGPVVERYVDFVFQPIRDAAGTVTGIFVEGVDVTDRTLAASALRQTEDRYRAFIENVDIGICVIEVLFDENGKPVDYLFLDANPALEKQTGIVGVIGRRMLEYAPNMEQHWFDTYGRVATTGEAAHFENGAEGLGGRWFDVHAIRVGEPSQRQVAVLFSDITERKRAEERRGVLNAELAHRLKNTLAIVSSIATQTLRSASDVTSARKALTDRIQALSKAHDILLAGRRDAGSVDRIVEGAVAIHDEGGRIRLKGPELLLGPKAALTLSLIVHELATNAAKYGALSFSEGHVDIVWSIEVDPETQSPTMVLDWTERGGPPVAAPGKKSFGTRLIEMGLSGSVGGSVDLDYAPQGLRCRIVAPLTELQADDEAA